MTVAWAPLSMGFSRKNTGVGCHALLQSIFLTQGSNPCLLYPLHWQAGSLPLGPPEKPHIIDVRLTTSILTSHKKLLCWGILHLYSKLHSNVRCFTMREIINSCHKKYTLKDISKSLNYHFFPSSGSFEVLFLFPTMICTFLYLIAQDSEW